MKLPGLAQCVLAHRGIQHQQHLVWSPRKFTGQHPLDLAQLVHEIGLRMKATGRVNQYHVHPACPSRSHSVEDHRGWVRALLEADHLDTDAIGPHMKLLDGRGAKRIRGNQQRLESILPEPLR